MDCIEDNMSNNYSIVAHVLIAMVTYLLSYCLAMIHTDTDKLMGFVKCIVEMGTGVTIYITFHRLVEPFKS
jgi:hypothetical protein